MKPLLFTIIGLLSLLVPALGQNVASATADRYNLSITNTYKYHLSVTLETRKKSTTRIMSPYSYWKMDGYFSKGKLKNKTVLCDYNSETYSLDKKILDNDLSNTLTSLRRQRDNEDNSAFRDLEIKILAELASKFHTNTDNWIIDGLSWVARGVGNTIKMAYSFKELIEEINSMNYKSYDELFTDFLADRFEKAAVARASELIEREIGLNSETSEYVINAVLYYLGKSTQIQYQYEENIEKAEDRHAQLIEEITALRDDRSFQRDHTYNLYDITRKPIDFRTKTPNFILSLEPLCYGSGLNKYWNSPPEKVLTDKDNNDELEWSDGLWNTTAGGSLRFSVTPEMKISKHLYSRVYAGASFYNTSYKHKNGISLSNNFFSTTPANSTPFTVSEPLSFEHNRLSLDLAWRFYIGRVLFFDLNGGYSRQNGVLNLKKSELSEGYSWAKTSINLVEENYQPFFGAKLGIGRNRFHKGTHLSCGVHFFKIDHTNTTDYSITETATDFPIHFDSEGKYVYRIFVGLSTAF